MRVQPVLLAALFMALAAVACSDDDNPAGGGTPDTTPPAVASVTAIDRYHFNVVFNEAVSKASAEDDSHYALTEAIVAAAAPGDPLYVVGQTLKADQRTVTITTESAMSAVSYTLAVQGVKDVRGNEIVNPIQHTFTGSTAADVTPPQITSRTPAPGATGVSRGSSVSIQFSEAVSYSSFSSGASWTSGGPIFFYIDGDGTVFNLVPLDMHDLGSVHTISLSGIEDASGNVMPDAQWSFTITNVADTTPPTLVSSVPANLATNVSTSTDISLTFSEAMDPDYVWITITPYLGDYVYPIPSNGGKTLTFATDTLLVDNTQYTVSILPGDVRDVSGNPYRGFTNIVFSTGGSLESGSIGGTISGDPGTAAADPTGAIVLAEGGDSFGASTVAGNNTYRIAHLPDDIYEVLAIKDTDGDGQYNFFAGDAIGAYGVNIDAYDFDADTVVVYGGNAVNGVNFPIYDPSAITGRLTYSGAYESDNWTGYVGLFEKDGFDPQNPMYPIAVTDCYPTDYEWYFNTLATDIPDGDYFLAAYIDVNDDGGPDAVDPYGCYGGPGAPTLVHIANGNDIHDIVFAVYDPTPAMKASGRHLTWKTTKPNPVFMHIGEKTREAQSRLGR